MNPTRRFLLSAGALSVVGASLPALASDPHPDLALLARSLATASNHRHAVTVAFRKARKRLARWGELHPRPDLNDGGAALLAWLEAYREAIEAEGIRDRHANYATACRVHETIARRIAAMPVTAVADVQALGAMTEHDCDGIVRAAMLAGMAKL